MDRRQFDRAILVVGSAIRNQHAGSANPVPARVIMGWIGEMTGRPVYPRDVSDVIRTLRESGEHIGHGPRGYFSIVDGREYDAVIDDIESRLEDMRSLLAILRRNAREFRRRQVKLTFGDRAVAAPPQEVSSGPTS